MDIKQMLALRQLLEAIAAVRKTEEDLAGDNNSDSKASSGSRIYYLSGEEREVLRCLDKETNLGKNYRLHLLRLATLVGIEPEQLLYLRRLAGLGVTAIES